MNAITPKTPTRSLFIEWTEARQWLLPALRRLNGLYEEDDIVAGLLAGSMRLWRKPHAAAVTVIETYPRMRLITTLLAGAETGYLHELMELAKEGEAYGIANGCKRVRLLGRKGWERVLPDFDFDYIAMTKEL